jgi:hypothetical protein
MECKTTTQGSNIMTLALLKNKKLYSNIQKSKEKVENNLIVRVRSTLFNFPFVKSIVKEI